MLKKIRGFTLIELLIVVAIIGILAALLIPNAITALQKAKQKATMKEIVTIATAVADYVTDQGQAPPATTLVAELIPNIVPFYLKAVSSNDQWNTPYAAHTSDAIDGMFGITSAMGLGGDDFVIASYGRDKTEDGWAYDTANPDAGLFTVNDMTDFASDLINWNGNWIMAPRSRVQ